MLFSSLISLVLLALTKVNAATVEISTNTLISTGDTLYYSDYIIDAGVYLAIDSGYTHNFYGDLTIYGMLYISDRNHYTGLTCDFLGTTNVLTNYGEIVLNDLNGTSAPTFDYYGGEFYNYGNVWFAGIGNTGGSTYAIQPYKTFVNEGIITYYQSVSRAGGTTHLGLDDSHITNNGTVCIYQQIFFQGSNIAGTGCFDVGLDSNFWVTNAYTRTIAETQTILLSTSSSSLRIDLYNPSFSYTVAGWGNGNVIGFSGAITSFSYSVDTLTIKSGGFTYTVVIGEGYDASQMEIGYANFGTGAAVANTNFGLLYAPAPPDSSRPSICSICPSIPDPPNGNVQTTITSTWTGLYTSTTTDTVTIGGIDTVIVEIPSNSQSIETSTWPGSFTTTVTESASQGGTDTVIVVVPSNSQSMETSTWTGSFTTTVTESASQGGTDTVIVVVPSNSQSMETSTWSGSFTTTVTESASQGGTDTVIVVVPTNSQSIETSTWASSFTTTVTESASQGGTDTVIVVVPSNSRSMETSTWSGSFTTTVTESASQGGTDTVIVVVPSNSQSMETSTWSGSFTTKVTESASQGGTDTVIVVVPTNSQSIETSTWASSFTTTVTESASQGGTDTVIVVVPTNSQSTELSTWSGSFTTTVTESVSQGGTDTVIVVVPSNSQSMETSTWTGSFTTTVTESASQGGTDTVIVVLPTISQTTSSSISSSIPTAEGCTAVHPSAAGFIGYFYEYSTSASLSSYLEGGYKSNKLEDTVEAIVDVEIVYDSANTLDLEGYFLPPLSGNYKFELSNIANGAALSIGADVAFSCGSTLSKRAVASPLIIEESLGTGELTVHLIAGIYYPISIVNNYIASGEHIEFVITGPNGVLSVDLTIFYIEQSETETSSTASISSSTVAVSSFSSATSEDYSSSLPSSIASNSAYWSNSSLVSTNGPSSTYSLSASSSVVDPSDRSSTFSSSSGGTSTTGTDTTITNTDISTTVITFTSCVDRKCTAGPVTTGITVVTTTIDEVAYEYTTYCPLASTNEKYSISTVTIKVTSTEQDTVSTGTDALVGDASVSQRTLALQTASTVQILVETSNTSARSSSTSNNYSNTPGTMTSGAELSSSTTSSSNTLPTITPVAEGKAAASFNISLMAVFVTYLVHMLL